MLFTRFIIWDDPSVYYDRLVQLENGYGYNIWIYYFLAEIDPHRIFVPFILFLYFFLCVVLLYVLLRKMKFFSDPESLFMAFLCGVSPLVIPRWSLATPYYSAILPFLAAMCLFLDVLRGGGMIKRLASLVLMGFALLGQAFSAVYGVLVIFFIVYEKFPGIREARVSLSTLKELACVLFKYIDYLLLPIVCLVIKVSAFPAYGSRAAYNPIPTNLGTLLAGFDKAFFASIPAFFTDLFVVIGYDAYRTRLLALVLFVFIFFWLRRMRFEPRSQLFWEKSALCFFILMGLSAYAHAVVNKYVGYYLTDSRCQFVLFLFFGSFVFSLIFFLAPWQNIRNGILSLVMAVFIATSFSMQMASLRQGHVEFSIVEKLSRQWGADVYVADDVRLLEEPPITYLVKVDFRFKFPIFFNYIDSGRGFWGRRPNGVILYDNPELLERDAQSRSFDCDRLAFFKFIPEPSQPLPLLKRSKATKYLYSDWSWVGRMAYLFDFDRDRYYGEIVDVGTLLPNDEDKERICGTPDKR